MRAALPVLRGAALTLGLLNSLCSRCSGNRDHADHFLVNINISEDDPALVHEFYGLACEEVAGICPKAAELLEEAEPDALAYLDFPYEHHRRLRTNNVQERANRELKRRSRVVQVFPSRR